MWQAQIIGRKTWKLVPPPECDHICNKMSVTVEPGDIGKIYYNFLKSVHVDLYKLYPLAKSLQKAIKILFFVSCLSLLFKDSVPRTPDVSKFCFVY